MLSRVKKQGDIRKHSCIFSFVQKKHSKDKPETIAFGFLR